jgi:hypothetical protein
LCHEIFGANATMRDVADYYAEEGYTVLVPDLFWRQAPGIELGYTAPDFERAMALYRDYDENDGVDDVAAALAALTGRPECTGKAGVLGLPGRQARLSGRVPAAGRGGRGQLLRRRDRARARRGGRRARPARAADRRPGPLLPAGRAGAHRRSAERPRWRRGVRVSRRRPCVRAAAAITSTRRPP